MQSMPLLLRQFRPSLLSTPVRTQLRPSARPKAQAQASTRALEATRRFSVCLRCQFRSRSFLYAEDKVKGGNENVEGKEGDRDSATAVPEGISRSGSGSGSAEETRFNSSVEGDIYRQTQGGHGLNSSTESGGLPSYAESRRSKYTKQFSEMMDNLQSNIFVAGQRLNDLTGYSSIEALKNEIHVQEERLRVARNHIREAKDAYAAAINRRSTSQREVNDLLQRKHAWSPTDLERFTNLYRNDHTNEVAENETQEALTKAEHEAEEAAAQLSKSILSRYHEEQVWSDKIRRMSTWGTWGLMGVNVLLFLVFQIAVEPWRRKRLVKGFEEKVIEAIEKEKVITQTEIANAQGILTDKSSIPQTTETPSAVNETATSDVPAVQVSETKIDDSTTTAIASTTDPATATPPKTTMNTMLDYSSQTLNHLFSNHSIPMTQRDLTAIAIQSAAAGAAVMGLAIGLLRPR